MKYNLYTNCKTFVVEAHNPRQLWDQLSEAIIRSSDIQTQKGYLHLTQTVDYLAESEQGYNRIKEWNPEKSHHISTFYGLRFRVAKYIPDNIKIKTVCVRNLQELVTRQDTVDLIETLANLISERATLQAVECELGASEWKAFLTDKEREILEKVIEL